jgi:aspartate aminotransferase
MPTVQELAERISWISESSTMKVAAEADRQRREGVDVVDFSAGEPDFPTPDNIKNAAIEALRQNFTKYTPVSGTVELRQTICDYHKRTYGTSYSVKECIGTIGGKHAIFNLVQALVDPGDEVIIPVPYWVTYKDVVNFAAGKCVFVNTDEQEGFVLSAAQLERHLTPKTRMIMLNSPCNPSGAVYERAEMEKIFRMAKDRGIWVMTDECYERFLYDSEPFSLASLPDAKETVVVAGSLSKTYAMTGWRIGYGIMPVQMAEKLARIQTNTNSCTATFTQRACLDALSGPRTEVERMLSEFKKRRDFIVKGLSEIPGFRCRLPLGAFYAFPNIEGTGIDCEVLAHRLLEEKGVASLCGTCFGKYGDGFLRFSYANSIENIGQAVERIRELVSSS